MIGFRTAEHPGAIALKGGLAPAKNAFELARFWISPDEGRSHVVIGFPDQWRLELLGSLLVESVHTAAKAYAQTAQMSEEEALRRIWQGLDEERARLNAEPAKESE
ncbi:DUF5076 domain-containing protein [Sphingobium yanoikuyae]|uniref:DUF5076 domain-containing protein n=1 Tax=Sphingobium yanoikuyae TaxID=13690 RepID=A0A6M4G4Y0_SPHYA|nr:DUF5076 domain-containing protein [Sphingobium yanoikuyae]QJR00747.1 DUF5076 domain-containing protein [Sphingobium yanoikuyae]